MTRRKTNTHTKSVFRVKGESGPENAVEMAGVAFSRHRGKGGEDTPHREQPEHGPDEDLQTDRTVVPGRRALGEP